MAIQREIWEQEIVENLWPANPHLNLCVNADQYVLQGKVVHIPNAGAAPVTQKNRTSLPASVARRQDIDVTYALDEYTSDPVLIVNADKAELSYDKRSSVLADTQQSINESVGVMMLYNWAPMASRILRTSGAAVPAHVGIGSRRKFALSDLKKAQKQFNIDNVPTDGRYAIIDAEMMDQLTDQLTETQYRDFSSVIDPATGVVGRLYGFTLLSRSQVLSYVGLNAVEPGTAVSPATCAAALCWHTSSVERALGAVNFFEKEGDPQYYGDIYSALVRLGGRIRRSDGKGVLAIVQGAESTPWASGTKYIAGQFVVSNVLTYICIADHTASAAFETDAAKWKIVE
ncbi:MAG: hypothetical protein RR921_02380 [Mucinivorans sp.]